MSLSLSNNDIINQVINNDTLKEYLKAFNPIKDNFFSIVEKVYNYIEGNNYELNDSNKYRIIIDILIKIINDLNITKNHQIYLMESIHTMVFDYEDELKKQRQTQTQTQTQTENNTLNINVQINEEEFYETESTSSPLEKETETETETDLNEFNNIVNELYQTIYDNIHNEKLKPNDIPGKMISIVSQVGNAISKYTNLSWDLKKQILISAFNKIQENIDKIFPNVNEIDKNIILSALSSAPSFIDYFISLTNINYTIPINNIMRNHFLKNIFQQN